MQQDRHHPLVARLFGRPNEILLCTCLADNNRIHCLEVRWIGRQIHVDIPSFEATESMGAQMILDVSNGQVALGEFIAYGTAIKYLRS